MRSRSKRLAANYEDYEGWRAHARAALKCVDCGAALVNAQNTQKKLCPTCKDERRLETARRHRRAKKAGTSGNQFSA